MNTYRAVIVVEKVTIVEVESASLAEAQEAIFNNQCEQIDEPTYQNPHIVSIEILTTD